MGSFGWRSTVKHPPGDILARSFEAILMAVLLDVIPRNPLFQWNVAKNIALFFVVSAHAAYIAELLNKCCTHFAYKLDFFRDL
jgi:hypothetical protein